jgi:hypothetical protein
MSIVSHLHQFFNAEMCQSYIYITSVRVKSTPLRAVPIPRATDPARASWADTYRR